MLSTPKAKEQRDLFKPLHELFFHKVRPLRNKEVPQLNKEQKRIF